MYKRIRKIVCLVLSLIMILTGMPVIVQAKTSTVLAAKAKKAYVKILTSEKEADGILDQFTSGNITQYKFALIDLNQDGVSELVFTPDDGYHVNVIAYVNGKVKCVGNGFVGTEKYYPNKSLYITDTWHMGNTKSYYKFDGKKMKQVAYASNEYADMPGHEDDYVYYIGAKKTTKSKYTNYINKLKKGAKEERLSWHQNTVNNRKKYLDSSETVTTVYSMSGNYISSFSKKNGKLIIKTTLPWDKWTESADGSSNLVETKKNNLSYSLAKDCKWEYYSVGELEPSGKISYAKLKKVIKEEYTCQIKDGYYESPTVVQICVKNNKIVAVRAVYP